MSRIVWNSSETPEYEIGVDRGILFPKVGDGIPWSGLTTVVETTENEDLKSNHYNGSKFVKRQRPGEFSASLDGLSYPHILDEFGSDLYDLTYRTLKSEDKYLIHLVYNARLKKSTTAYNTVSLSSRLTTQNWMLSTRPIKIEGIGPVSHLIIDTSQAYPWTVDAFEELLYGGSLGNAKMPSIPEVLEVFEINSILRIIDNGDGTWTADGPDDVVYMTGVDTFEINWPTVIYLDSFTYKVSSL